MSFPTRHLFKKRGYWFHNLIVFMDRLELIPAPRWIIAAGVGAGLCALAWPKYHFLVFISLALPLALEAVLLREGQSSGRAPGPFAGPFFLFVLGHLGASWFPLLLPLAFSLRLAALLIIQTGLLAAMVYGSRIEPFRVKFREVRVDLGKGRRELRCLLIADLHLDRPSPREAAVMKFARKFSPDLILIPGDLTNLSFVGDRETRDDIRTVLRALRALAPVLVSRGTPEVEAKEWLMEVTAETGVRVLDEEKAEIEIKGVGLELIGVPCDDDFSGRERALTRLAAEKTGRPLILLHHSPDLIELAAKSGIDLYVTGHTHGGQVRLPLIGPLYAASRHGCRYAGGTYRVGRTTMIVSRGLGLEGAGAPRLRFLCPPEVVGIILRT